MTNYVIFKAVTGSGQTSWEQITAMYARNGETAIDIVAKGGGGPGTYRAVPARFWRPPITWPK